jgi:stalled ribosome rescue protein Dom34
MNLKNLEIEQIRDYIRAEREKGRSMEEIVKEVAASRNDVTILSHNSKTGRQQISSALRNQLSK